FAATLKQSPQLARRDGRKDFVRLPTERDGSVARQFAARARTERLSCDTSRGNRYAVPASAGGRQERGSGGARREAFRPYFCQRDLAVGRRVAKVRAGSG